jgi:adenylate cyclase
LEPAAPDPVPHADEVEIEFWDTIKHSSNTLEYRVYLERYPEGAFSPLAMARLDSLENGHAQVAPTSAVAAVDPKAIELAFWETVKDSTNAEMYEAYVEKYPEGEFVRLAEAKLAELSRSAKGTPSGNLPMTCPTPTPSAAQNPDERPRCYAIESR